MKSRKDFPELLNALNLRGWGAEIGVAEGIFAECILRSWYGQKLLLVDPYQFQYSKLDRSDKHQQQHDYNYGQAIFRLLKFRGRHKFIVEKSEDAARGIDNLSLDFVYIDAKHDYRSVWADLTAWYPKIKCGGILAGHDYKNSFVRKNLVEVKRAVDKFCYGREKVHKTLDDSLPSWYIQKV